MVVDTGTAILILGVFVLPGFITQAGIDSSASTAPAWSGRRSPTVESSVASTTIEGLPGTPSGSRIFTSANDGKSMTKAGS